MKKVFISFCLAALLCFSCISSLAANASIWNESPFDDITFNLQSTNTNELSTNNYKYYTLLAYNSSNVSDTPVNDSNTKIMFLLFYFNDVESDNGNIYIDTTNNSRFLHKALNFTVGSDIHKFTGYYTYVSFKYYDQIDGSYNFSNSQTQSKAESFLPYNKFFRSDLYYGVEFPWFPDGAPPTYRPTWTILASNADVYDSDNSLVFRANYQRLIDYVPLLQNFASDLGQTITPTEPHTYEDQFQDEQSSNSRTIIGKLSDVWQGIRQLPQRIADSIQDFFLDLKQGILDGLEYLFIPTDNALTDLIAYIKNNFGFITQLANITNVLLTAQYNGNTPPSFNITFPQSWGGQTYTTFNENFWFVLSSQWRTFIYSWVLAIMTYITVKKLHRSINDLINGESRKGGDFFD